jgi:hypothetical protein
MGDLIVACEHFNLASVSSSSTLTCRIPVDASATTLPTWQLPINDTSKPIWAYCQNPGPPTHCSQGDCSYPATYWLRLLIVPTGMVFAVNPPTDGDHTFEAFQALANSTANTASSASSSASSASGTSTSAYVTPPPPSAVTVTVTVTAASSTWTTTYASYSGSGRASEIYMLLAQVGWTD